MSEPTLEQLLEAEFSGEEFFIGEVVARKLGDGRFELAHRNTDVRHMRMAEVSSATAIAPQQASDIPKFDEAGNYRPLRTAPNLRRDWRIIVENIAGVIEAIEAIYPARLAIWRAWKMGRLTTTSMRETLNRQSGIYRVAAKISNEQINEVVGNFCRSEGGCLRTILWKRDERGAVPSTKLPAEKYDPAADQAVAAGAVRGELSAPPRPTTAATMPLLCQEACNLLVAACREAVKRG